MPTSLSPFAWQVCVRRCAFPGVHVKVRNHGYAFVSMQASVCTSSNSACHQSGDWKPVVFE